MIAVVPLGSDQLTDTWVSLGVSGRSLKGSVVDLTCRLVYVCHDLLSDVYIPSDLSVLQIATPRALCVKYSFLEFSQDDCKQTFFSKLQKCQVRCEHTCPPQILIDSLSQNTRGEKALSSFTVNIINT